MSTLIDKSSPARRVAGLLLASDGFGGVFGTTDGAGSNIAGGSGLDYTQLGTWANSNGRAGATVLSGGVATAYINAGRANVVTSANVTRSGGVVGLLLRYADGNNFVTCRHDGTNVLLIKKVGGVDTTVQTTAAAYVAGVVMTVVAVGSAFTVYYNGIIVGATQTIADAALQSALRFGLYTTNTGNTFDNFAVFAI